MLDQNTDRMWFVIGAVIVGAAIIFIANGTMPEIFASVTDTFQGASDKATSHIDIEMQNSETKRLLADKDIENITEGLILHYDLTSGSGNTITDVSGNGLHGTLVDFNHTAESGWVDGGLRFDGVDDYAYAPGNMSFPDETITLHARLTYHGLDFENGEGRLGTILKKGHPDKVAPHTGFALSYDNRGNDTDFSYTAFGNPEGGFNGGGNSFDSRSSQMKLTNNRTYSFTVTVDEQAVGRLYIDGRLAFERQFSNEVRLNNTDQMLIGTWVTARASRRYPVTMESIRIYDRALDPVEVMMNYEYELGG